MITNENIRLVREMIGNINSTIGLFLNGNIYNLERHVSKYEFPKYEQWIQRVEKLLSSYFDFALDSVNNKEMIENVYLQEYDAFFDDIYNRYFKNFQRPTRTDVRTEIQNQILREDFDVEERTIEILASDGFNDYKVALYDILNVYKIKLQNRIVTNYKPLQLESTPNLEKSKKLIQFATSEISNSLYNGLKPYFEGDEKELKKALEGYSLAEPLLFPINQNQLTEVFRRCSYNKLLSSSKIEIAKWLCTNFNYYSAEEGIKPFNKATVYEILTKGRGEPPHENRICEVEGGPYKTQSLIRKEKALSKIN